MGDALENLVKLPELCFVTGPSTGATIMIKRGEAGYYPVVMDHVDPAAANAALGVTPQQAAAMLHGSCFGWHTKSADPDEQGTDEQAAKLAYGVSARRRDGPK